MKDRKELHKYVYNCPASYEPKKAREERRKDMMFEVLLDIRELLMIHTPEQQLRDEKEWQEKIKF